MHAAPAEAPGRVGTRLPGARHPLIAVLALSLGGFAIGSTEFTVIGLLPGVAADLLPGLWATSHARAVAQSGDLVAAYAAGVVVGAPLIAAFAARLPRKRLLLLLLTAIVVGTLATAVLPSFGLVVLARFVSGLPHGAYFGVASLAAADALGPNRRGQAVAWVLGGLTIANLGGVPLLTFVGQNLGWRVAYLVVAGLFAATFVAVLVAVPDSAPNPHATVRRELAAFRKGQVWLTLVMAAVGFGGLFAAYTYVAPLTTDVAGLPSGVVPIVLIVFGAGMTTGNIVGGLFIDRGVLRAVLVFFGALLGSLLLLDLTASMPVGLMIGVFAVGGASAALSPAIQVRLQDLAPESTTIAAAMNHSALNLGNALGAAVGGLVIAAGLGYLASVQVGVLMAVAGILLATVSLLWQRRRIRRAALAAA